MAQEKQFEEKMKKYLKEHGCWFLKYWGRSIRAGKTIDVYFEHDADGKRFIKEHGNEVFIQVVKAVG